MVVTNQAQHVRTLGGDDLVCVTGSDLDEGHHRPVDIDAGPGDDGIGISGIVTDAASVDGGEGRDSIGLPMTEGGNALTNALPGDTGELRHGAVPLARWTDLEIFYLRDPQAGAASVSIAGGPDSESFSLSGEGRTVADLRGTGDANRLTAVSCDVTARGRGGDDSFSLSSDHVWEHYKSCGGKTLMVGGSGDDRFFTHGRATDRLVGGSGDDEFDSRGGRDTILGGEGPDTARTGNHADRFIGGPGKDRVDGEQGRDRCVAERERRCER